MSSFAFKPAKRQDAKLLIGLASGTGGGKTWSAMALATGIAGGKRFAVIDTEAGRALHYADNFAFDHGDLHAPFTPEAYTDAILAADAAGYPVIIVDSMSHEWAGDGGILDMQEAEIDRMAGDNWQKRESVKMASWIKPKGSHKRMMQKLLQIRAHVILCFRAEPKIEMVREDGRMKIVPKATLTGLDGWVPVCEKALPFELTASFLLMADKPGFPRPIKLPEALRACFPLDRPIDAEAGRRVAAWATGEVKPAPESDIDLDEWREPHKDAILSATDLPGLQKAFNTAYKAATKRQDSEAMAEFTTLKDGVKNVLYGAG